MIIIKAKCFRYFDKRELCVSHSNNITDEKDYSESTYLIRTLSGHDEGIYAMALTPDGEMVVSGTPNVFKIWSVESGSCDKTFDSSKYGGVWDIQITLDGQYILVVTLSNAVEIINLSSIERLTPFIGHNKKVFTTSISTDSKLLVSGSEDQTIKVWDFATGTCQATLKGHHEAIYA
jgi:WD40 repeat protein